MVGRSSTIYFFKKKTSDYILESLYKLRMRESAQLKTVLDQKISMPNYQKN